MIKRLGLRVFWGVLGSIALTVMVLLGVRSGFQYSVARDYQRVLANGINHLQAIPVRGTTQWIRVQGTSLENPFLLFLHWGPGASQLPFSRLDLPLLSAFTVVHWDQRGAGKSFTGKESLSDLSLENTVQDALVVIQYLQKTYGASKLVLVGHSWGSVVGAHLAAQYPHLFNAFVGVNQIADFSQSQQATFQYFDAHFPDQAITQKLRSVAPFPVASPAQFLKKEQWIQNEGGLLYGHNMRQTFQRLLPFLLTEPSLSWKDLSQYFKANQFSVTALYKEMRAVNLREQVPQIPIPTYFFLGRQDLTTFPGPTVAYIDALQTPSKQVVWFESSAHMPFLEEPEQYVKALKKVHQDVLVQYD